MTTGRDGFRAALPGGQGAGPRRLQTLATKALEKACVDPWGDPLRLALALGRDVRALLRAEERASLDGRCINYLWVQTEPTETGLNVFFGNALAVFEDEGTRRPCPADVARLAGYLALPDPNVPPDLEFVLQTHVPMWFIREHQRRRRWDKWSASGIFAAVGAVGQKTSNDNR